MLRDELESYLAQFLSIDEFNDYCPNGLQVEGADEIKNVVSGVTASQALIEYAIKTEAQAILVHHGYFWKGEAAAITKIKKKRIKALLDHDISLFAYHLPLDTHPGLGNNIQLANLLELPVVQALEKHGRHDLGLVCHLDQAVLLSSLIRSISERLGREPMVLGPQDEGRKIQSVALCTGGAQSMFESAIVNHGVDAYLSGEVSEPNFHLANEYGCNYLALGHHASERYGAKALGEHLAEQFGLSVDFVDLDNPV